MSDMSVPGASQPFPRVNHAISRDVASGSIPATDQTALTAAISDIGAQLSAGDSAATPAASSASTTTGTQAAPASMRDRVNSLIDDEVSSGKLTSDQATELKSAFAQAQTHMHGAHGHGHHGGGGGIAALLGTDAATGTTATGATSTTGPTSTTASATTTADPLQAAATNAVTALDAFITRFKAAVSANGLYGATGANGTASPSMLINSIG